MALGAAVGSALLSAPHRSRRGPPLAPRRARALSSPARASPAAVPTPPRATTPTAPPRATTQRPPPSAAAPAPPPPAAPPPRTTAPPAPPVPSRRAAPRVPRRSALRRALLLAAASLAPETVRWTISPSPSRAAAAAGAKGNDAVLAALKRKADRDLVEDGGAVRTRLNLALDELRRAAQLARVGEYANARDMLRRGNLERVRGDLSAAARALRVQRPTFDQFEGLAVVGGLDAFDAAMRARQRGVEAVTQRDVDVNARAAIAALEEACYVLGKDKTYEDMKARLEGGDDAGGGGGSSREEEREEEREASRRGGGGGGGARDFDEEEREALRGGEYLLR